MLLGDYMGHRETIMSNAMEFYSDIANGDDDPYFKTRPCGYEMHLVRGGKATIARTYKAYWHTSEGLVCLADDWRVMWPEYSMEYEGQFDRSRADSVGMSLEEMQNIITTRLIKKIHGEAVDPTMYLTEIDKNFTMVAKRANQGLEFLKNLKNPKKLAQLTLRYFRGKETRRSLTKRYTRARQAFVRRAKRWKTRDWSSSFLEYQFGWRPLCEDTWKLIGLAREAKRRQNQHRVVAGIIPREVAESWTEAAPTGRPKDIGYATAKNGGHGKLLFEITNPWLRAGASLEPPSYTAWDNIPYSWLADCVTNVGQKLKYALYDSGLGLLSGYCTTFKTTKCHVVIDSSPDYSHYDVYSDEMSFEIVDGRLSYEAIHNRRYVYTDFPEIPWFNKIENTLQNTELLVTIGAFLHQTIASFANDKRWYYAVP